MGAKHNYEKQGSLEANSHTIDSKSDLGMTNSNNIEDLKFWKIENHK